MICFVEDDLKARSLTIGPHFGWNGNMLEVRRNDSPEYKAQLHQALDEFAQMIGAEDYGNFGLADFE